MEELLRYCSEVTGYEVKEVRNVVTCFLEKIGEELSSGNSVDLGDDFGVFSTKLRTSHLSGNSPRSPKDDYYKVIFRESSGLKRKLKIPDRQAM